MPDSLLRKPYLLVFLPFIIFTVALFVPSDIFAGRTCCYSGGDAGDATDPSCVSKCSATLYTKSTVGGFDPADIAICKSDPSCVVCGDEDLDGVSTTGFPAASDCDSGGDNSSGPLTCKINPQPKNMYMTVGDSVTLNPNLRRTPRHSLYISNITYSPILAGIVSVNPAKRRVYQSEDNAKLNTSVTGLAVGETSIRLLGKVEPYGYDYDVLGLRTATCNNSTGSILVAEGLACVPGAVCQTTDGSVFATGKVFNCTMPTVTEGEYFRAIGMTGATSLTPIYYQRCDLLDVNNVNRGNYDQNITLARSAEQTSVTFKNFRIGGTSRAQYTLKCSFKYCLTGAGINLCTAWGEATLN
ncbi:hypothetical protein C4564_03325 [Candidatus Microgenomates bacterium]|nr:MAG: hypothetical protein C4564_03325 [Candidatus Microgenomates bacterium]